MVAEELLVVPPHRLSWMADWTAELHSSTLAPFHLNMPLQQEEVRFGMTIVREQRSGVVTFCEWT